MEKIQLTNREYSAVKKLFIEMAGADGEIDVRENNEISDNFDALFVLPTDEMKEEELACSHLEAIEVLKSISKEKQAAIVAGLVYVAAVDGKATAYEEELFAEITGNTKLS